MLLSKCAICGSRISRFTKEKEASVLLSRLSSKTPIGKIPLFGDTFF